MDGVKKCKHERARKGFCPDCLKRLKEIVLKPIVKKDDWRKP